jgi:hypothetical protein
MNSALPHVPAPVLCASTKLLNIGRLTGALLISAATASAAAVDLGTWTAESYAAVAGFGAGVWTVAPGGGSVTQSVNGQPTIFYSDFTAQGTAVTGTIRPGTGDNDYVGFVLGYQPGDNSSASANYLLVDWKQGNQNFDFGAPSSSPGGIANSGLAVSRVTGLPDADEFWQHANLGGTPAGSGLTELQRGATLGATGWVANTDYLFKFDFGPNNLQVSVNNVLQLNIAGNFSDGRLGFYNFSQANVVYSAFTRDVGTFPPGTTVPDAGSSLVLLGLGLVTLAAIRRRRPVNHG